MPSPEPEDRHEAAAISRALGGAVAIGSPLAARAQPAERVRVIGILMPLVASDANGQARLAAFQQELQRLGWIDGRNLRIETRWSGGSPDDMRKYAADLVTLVPDVILGPGTAPVGPLLQATRTVPIVFVHVVDPVGAGFVNSLARPDGNATGFIQFEYGISGKWLELLKQIVPNITRVAVVRDAAVSSGTGQFGAIQSAAPSLGVEATPVNVRDDGDIERDIAAFARLPNGGLIVTASALAAVHRDFLVTVAARHKLPAVYYERNFVAGGGLISYGPDLIDQYRRAAGYVDRILKGEKPADLPVQAPIKYETGDQSQDRESAGPHRAAIGARPRRRGDRVVRCRLLAQSGHHDLIAGCPQLGVKRTWQRRAAMSPNDPKRTSPWLSQVHFQPLQEITLTRYAHRA